MQAAAVALVLPFHSRRAHGCILLRRRPAQAAAARRPAAAWWCWGDRAAHPWLDERGRKGSAEYRPMRVRVLAGTGDTQGRQQASRQPSDARRRGIRSTRRSRALAATQPFHRTTRSTGARKAQKHTLDARNGPLARAAAVTQARAEERR